MSETSIFEQKNGDVLVLKIGVGNPVPSKYNDLIFDNGFSDHFGASLLRKDGKWFVYSGKFKFLPLFEVKQLVNHMNSEYINEGIDASIEIDGKAIRRMVACESAEFLNSLAETDGVVIYSVVLFGLEDTLITIKYPESVATQVSELLLNYTDSAKFSVEILSLTREENNSIPSFFKFHNLIKFNYSNLVLVQTRWIMSEEEMKNENLGIFQNQMAFQYKYFDPESSNIVGEFNSNINEKDIRSNADFKILEDKKDRLVEFKVKSKYFTDFYNNIINPMNGPFFYWGYSNGKGTLEIPSRDQNEFLKGINNHWSEPSRAKHRNMIMRVENIGDIVERYGFRKYM